MPRPITEPKGFIAAPGTVQVEMIYQYMDVTAENVYHVLLGTGGTEPTLAQMQTIAGIFENWETVTARSARCTSTKLNTIRVRQLGVPDGIVYDQTPVSPVTGTAVGQAVPGNVTMAIKWHTAVGGRSNRGRTFHIGMTMNHVLGNQGGAGFAAAMTSTYDALRSAIAGTAPFQLAVVSYVSQKQWRDTAKITPILRCSTDNNVDSQRRRLAGRGS